MWAAGERLELDSPFPSYLRLGTLSQGSVGQSERPTVLLCGMEPGLDSSSLLCLFGSLVEMGIKQGRYIGGGAHGRSLRSLMLCVMWWRGSCAPACIIPLCVTTAFSPGNQLWDLEFEQWWWFWECYTQSMGCLVFLNVFYLQRCELMSSKRR